MKNIHFFALREDILALLNLVEDKGPLNYTLTGNFLIEETKNGISTFDCAVEIPHLGIAAGNASTLCEAYLVTERDTPVELRHLKMANNPERICVDQLANADSVILLPGGSWNHNVVIQGHIGTASESESSQVIMRRFQAALKKLFAKVKVFHVGPSAMLCLQEGGRLTNSTRSPREYDLALR